VGTDESFFEVGGHSLLATQVTSRLRQAIGVEVPLRWIFEQPSAAALGARLTPHLPADMTAAWAARSSRREAGTDVSRQAAAGLPLTFAQERGWRHLDFVQTNISGNIPAVIMSGSVEVGGPTMPSVLQANDAGLDLVVFSGGAVYPLSGDVLIAREGLSAVLVEPAIKLLRDKGAGIQFGHELREFGMSADHVGELKFGEDAVALAQGDAVVMAVPPRAAAALLPGLKTPSKFRAIVNAHFRFDPPRDMPPITGVVGGLVEWLFAFPQRLSITISNGDRLVDMPREELAQAIWRDICKAGGVQGDLPPWQIVRERRATFEATPEQNALRPGAPTALKNLFLAGDWTDTGLPATIEGSVRSGDRAADLVLAMRRA